MLAGMSVQELHSLSLLSDDIEFCRTENTSIRTTNGSNQSPKTIKTFKSAAIVTPSWLVLRNTSLTFNQTPQCIYF